MQGGDDVVVFLPGPVVQQGTVLDSIFDGAEFDMTLAVC